MLSSFETLSSGQWIFDIDLSTPNLSYLSDHRVFDEPIFPAAGYIELLLAIMAQMGLTDAIINNLEVIRPIRLSQQVNNRLQLILQPESANRSSIVLRHV